MKRILFSTLAVSVLFVAQTRADEAAQAVLDKAIKATGGAENLTKYKAANWKGKGTFYGFGQGLPYTSEGFRQLPGQMKTVLEFDAGGMKAQIVRVINGNKAWLSNMGAVQELDKEQMTEAQEALHADRVASLVALKDPAYQLTALGDSMVDKTAVVGVKVSHKGHRDVRLFFDKSTGLLRKAIVRVKDQNTGGKEIDQEMFFSGHKDVQGAQVAMKIVLKREGKVYVENEITEYKRLEKLDEKVFEKPE